MKINIIKGFLTVIILILPVQNSVYARNRVKLRINRLITGNAIPGRKSVYARWLKGKTIYSYNSSLAVTPASCMKILTTATALRWMGKGYKFSTRFYGRISRNKMVTPLYWWSNGDPSFSIDNLIKLVSTLKKKGVASIPKGVVIDNYYFRKKAPSGFQKWRGSKGYITKPSAVAVAGNGVTVSIERVHSKLKFECTPASPFISCKNFVKEGRKTKNIRATAKLLKSGILQVKMFGVLGKKTKKVIRRVRSFDPVKFTSGVLIKILNNAGIKVAEKYRRKRVPKNIPMIREFKSESLSILVGKTNKHSNNFWAENILRALGAFKMGTPGSTTKGLKLVSALMQRSGLKRRYFHLSNGSGLYGRNKLSSRYLVKAMKRLYTIPWLHRVMVKSLARPGEPGTLQKRFKNSVVTKYLHGKTGTLNNASCLAGYITKGRKTIIFAVMLDKIKGEIYKARLFQKDVVETLGRFLLGKKIRTRPPRLF